MSLKAFLSSPARVVIAGALLGATVGLTVPFFLRESDTRFETSIAFTIDQVSRQKTADYAYDGYYALKASELFADTLISWFKTPAFAAEAYGYRADTPEEAGWAARAAAGFRAKKLSSQTVVISYRTKTPGAPASADAKRLTDLAIRRAASMHLDAEGKPLFTLTAAAPITVDKNPTQARTALLGLLIGAFLSAALLFFAAPDRPARE